MADRKDQGAAYRGALRECLEELAATAREAVDLRYQEGASGVEIAAILGISEANVKVTMHRARQQLRGCIEGKL